MHVDTLLTADMESSGISDIDVPCPGQPALVHRFPGVSRSLAEPRDKPIPPAIPQFHSHPPSTPHDDGHPISTPPAPRWFLKVTLDQDTRRLPFLCSGTPSFHDVLTGVCTLFHLTPFDPAASPILSYRDLDGDTCTLTNTTYHDALPLFAATRIIRLSLAATHLAVTRPSTLSPDATPPFPGHLPPTPPATRLQLTPLLVSRGISFFYDNLTAKNTTMRLLNGSPNIVTILAPCQPSIPFHNFRFTTSSPVLSPRGLVS